VSGSKWLATAGFVASLSGPEKPVGERYSGDFNRPPVETWRVPLPGPPFPAAIHTELGQPLLHGDHIYVGQAGTDGLHVLARDSGALIQTLEMAAPVQSAPVVVQNVLVATDLSGTTIAWDLGAEGKISERWRRSGGAPVLSAAAVTDSLVIVSGVDNVVTAVHLDSGELAWRHAQRLDPGRSAELELYGAPTPTVHNNEVLVGFSDGTVAALDLQRGDSLWQRRVGEGQYPDILGSPVVVGEDIVVAGYSEPLVGMHANSRNVRWRLDIGGSGAAVAGGGTESVPAPQYDAAEEHAFVFHGGEDGILRCVDTRTGAMIWEWDSETQSALTQPVPTEAGLLVGAAAGTLYLVRPSDGKEVWRWRPGFHVSGITVAPGLEGRQAVAVTNQGNIVSFVVPRDPPPWGQDDGFFSRLGGRPDYGQR
jgi:outer membrane protein assembly factor BamB